MQKGLTQVLRVLSTPTGDDANNVTREVHHLLPTPLAGDVTGGRTTKGSKRQAEVGLRLTVKALLPTPGSRDGENSSEQGFRYYEGQGDNPTLLGAARRTTETSRMSSGETTSPPSDSGNGSPDPPPGQLTLGDA